MLLSLILPKNTFAQEIDFDQIPLEAFKQEVKEAADTVLLSIEQNEDGGKAAFAEFLRKYRKDGDQMYRVAQYFIDKDRYHCAKICFDQALNAYPKHRKVLEMKAAISEKIGDLGAAGSAYEEILTYVDSADVRAIRMTAYNYRIANPALSMDYFNKILKKDPNDGMANMWMGWHAYNDAVAERAAGRKKKSEEYYTKAAGYYETYYGNTPVDSLVIYHCERYVQSLPTKTSKELKKMIKLCKTLEKQAPQSKIFKQYKFAAIMDDPGTKEMLESYETLSERQQIYRMMCSDADEAVLYIKEKQFPDSLYNYTDYYYASRHAGFKGELDEAVAYQEKAIALDTANIGGYNAMYDLYFTNNKFKEALSYFLITVDMKKKHNIANIEDTTKLAQLYGQLLSHEADSLQRSVWYHKADSIWAYIHEIHPTFIAAVQQRARLARQFFPGNFPKEALPIYEELVSSIGDKTEEYKDEMAESMHFFAYHYLEEKNYRKTLKYLEDYLVYVPQDSNAEELVKALKARAHLFDEMEAEERAKKEAEEQAKKEAEEAARKAAEEEAQKAAEAEQAAAQSQEQQNAEQPAEEQPAEAQSTEEQPTETQPAEEQPAEEQQNAEQPAEEQPAEAQSTEEQPTETQPAEEQPTEEKPVEEQPAEEQSQE